MVPASMKLSLQLLRISVAVTLRRGFDLLAFLFYVLFLCLQGFRSLCLVVPMPISCQYGFVHRVGWADESITHMLPRRHHMTAVTGVVCSLVCNCARLWAPLRDSGCTGSEITPLAFINRWNKKLSCHRPTARCFVSLNISLSHSRSLKLVSFKSSNTVSY